MGYILREKEEVIITEFVGPGPAAKHKHNSFVPDYIWQNEECGKIYDQTNGLITYIGDWHTHPDNLTDLSQLDINALCKISEHKEANCVNPIMLIMGNHKCTVVDVYQLLDYSKPMMIENFDFEGVNAKV